MPGNDDEVTLVRLLADEVRTVGDELAGKVELGERHLSALNGALKLSVELHRDQRDHPSLAHAHVFAEFGRGPRANLEACIVGVGGDRDAALAEVAHNWITLAGAPILSVLHARPVLGAAHFEGDEAWGVPRGHGFLGSLAGRGVEGVFDLDALVEEPLFTGAVELAPDGVLHLAKVTLNVAEGPSWSRNLEIDGHAAARADDRWRLDTPPPSAPVICTRFAVFWRADQNAPEFAGAAASTREKPSRPMPWSVDDAIERFVASFQEQPEADLEPVLHELLRQGVARELAEKVIVFVPLAFGRLVLDRVGVAYSSDFTRAATDGTYASKYRLDDEPIYRQAVLLAPSYAASPRYGQAFEAVCAWSGEVSIVSDALGRNDDPRTITLGPPVISMPPAEDRKIHDVARAIAPSVKPAAAGASRAKRWWQFWR
jgi:hypothetical protein